LEGDLNYWLLELCIIKNLEGISVNEEQLVAFNFGMAWLNKAVILGFFSPLVAVEA
jgi:hypothetical protein